MHIQAAALCFKDFLPTARCVHAAAAALPTHCCCYPLAVALSMRSWASVGAEHLCNSGRFELGIGALGRYIGLLGVFLARLPLLQHSHSITQTSCL